MMNAKYCINCGQSLELKIVDNKERLSCSSDTCNYVLWDNPIPVVAAIIEYKGKIILVRNEGWPEKIFGLVSGFLEKDETPEQGIIREVKEELNLNVKLHEFVGNYSFFQMNQLLIVYHIVTDGNIQLSNEIAEIKNIQIDKLKGWSFGTGFAVTDWIEKRKKL